MSSYPLLPPSAMENHGRSVGDKYRRTLSHGEKADNLGASGPWEWQGDGFPGFSFSLMCPGLGAKEASDSKTPLSTDKK